MNQGFDVNGDITVCGVSADEVIDDIARSAPKGVPVTIPGDLAQKSKDLWRMLSQGRLFQLNVHSLMRNSVRAASSDPAPVSDGAAVLADEYNKAVAEIEKLRGDLSRARSETIAAREEVSTLRAEVARLLGELTKASKLDEILTLLKERPASIAPGAATPTYVREAPDLSDDVPVYIPSQIKSDSAAEGRMSVQEGSSDGSTLSDASRVLREKRKREKP